MPRPGSRRVGMIARAPVANGADRGERNGTELAARPFEKGDDQMGILLFIIFGFFVGLIARALMPGRQSMGLLMTMLLGIVGSFVGGFLGNLIAGREVSELTSAGFLGSLVGALLVLLAIGPLVSRRRLMT